MSLLFQGSAVAVDDNLQTYNFEEWVEVSKTIKDNPKGYVCTSTMRIAVPEVIRLTKYNKLPDNDVKFTRHNIYEHYQYTCCYCSKECTTRELNLDHVLAKSKGGRTDWDNIVLACIPCNTKKGDKTPEEAGMKLQVRPTRPKWRGVQTVLQQAPAPVPISWQRLLDRAYWDQELKS